MLFVLFISVFLLNFSQVLSIQKCNPEDCIPVPYCTAATEKLIKAQESGNQDYVFKFWEFLSTIQCDKTDNEQYITKICCPRVFRQEPFEREVSDQDSLQQTINQHQNLGLLPETCGSVVRDQINLSAEQNYPWLASILYENGIGCAGSIISERYVLTVAHCVKGATIERVRLGEYDMYRSDRCRNIEIHGCDLHVEDILVEETIVHEGYKGDQYIVNDIALIRLQSPADFSQPNIAPICLPKTWDLCQKNMSGIRAKVSDWKLGQPYYTYIGEELPIITDCVINGGKIVCDQSNACGGDLGSPLMVKSRYNDKESYIQYGIICDGFLTCNENEPRSYIDVTKHMKWILDNMKP